MKKLLLVLILGATTFISAQNINGRFSSSIYSFQRYNSEISSENYLRAYEMLNLNLNYGKFSVKSYLNFETDVMTKMENDPRLRFYNLYLEGRDLFNVATIKLGRQPIFNSVAGGVYDGASVILKHNEYKLNLYAGGSVPAYQDLKLIENFEDNLIFGGKFTTTIIPDAQIGIGYVNKNFQPASYRVNRLDSTLFDINTLIENKSNQYEFITGEINYHQKGLVSIFTRGDYDLNFNQISKIEFDARTEAVDSWGLNFYYNYRLPKVRYNSIFAVFDYGNTQEIELGADYKACKFVTITGKFANVQYKAENSQRLGIGFNTSYGSLSYRKTFGFAGELDAVSLYTAYTLFEGLLTPSAGLSFTSYKITEDSETNHITTLLVGANVRPFRVLSFDLQGQFMDNKIYKNDLRVFFKLNYWFNLNL